MQLQEQFCLALLIRFWNSRPSLKWYAGLHCCVALSGGLVEGVSPTSSQEMDCFRLAKQKLPCTHYELSLASTDRNSSSSLLLYPWCDYVVRVCHLSAMGLGQGQAQACAISTCLFLLSTIWRKVFAKEDDPYIYFCISSRRMILVFLQLCVIILCFVNFFQAATASASLMIILVSYYSENCVLWELVHVGAGHQRFPDQIWSVNCNKQYRWGYSFSVKAA